MELQNNFQITKEQEVIVSQVPQVQVQKSSANSLIYTSLPLALGIFGTIILIWFLNSFLCICKPNEVVVLSGRKRKTSEGQEIGYRVLTGGRGIRIPILETIKRIDVTTMPVPVKVTNAYAKGGTPLNIQAIANVKISSNPKVVGNAIERFLDQNRSEIVRVARETLEGNLRGVVATLTPEQLNENRLQFSERIASDVSRDLVKLGLQLDTLKIQNISDDVDYLNSLGRRQIALVIKEAEIAESNAVSEAEQIEAQCEEQASVAKTQNRIVVQDKENELRKIKAELDQKARSEEERTIAAAQEATAKAQQKLQAVRAQLERLRLEAEQVLPAEAQKQAKELIARGNAAGLKENTEAYALVNEMLSQVWQSTGKDAKELFLIQQLETVLQEAVQIPGKLNLEKVNVIDNGDGKAIASLVKVYPEIVVEFLNSVNKTLGIDVIGTLNPPK
ncbi:band 7 protein [Stanieria cyanosphaera PCC 7437]|uniref:Band 7 protein n=1 Tax=Stanieria cyanosphaera (strain ATCC 29371 / PCC 7437) TaxID=111780 RepID=K9XVE1_STAC7|nr:SPFH domain-containing protein [Stanieria cyanosphaera]AFZ35627.1 band 7 protein [Stanieria cyanosphaera PCC 7437]